MSPLLDPFVRGVIVGVMLVSALAVWRTGVSLRARIGTLVGMATISAWTLTESSGMRTALGDPLALDLLSMMVGSGFWLFVAATFEDRPFNAWTLAPFAVLLATGVSMGLTPPRVSQAIWLTHNLIGGGLCLHAGFIIVRGWRSDLIESRRRLRGLIFGFAALFGVAEVAFSFVARIDGHFPWRTLTVGGLWGGVVLAGLTLASSVLLLQGRSSLFGVSRRAEARNDARGGAADRLLLDKLEAFMAQGGWKTESLTIGAVARTLETPEHRLRRLINQQLGHRNFVDFVNGHRIEAAKLRLSNPAEARTTVAVIAFDLGYGSLGPFNRAFRAATGATPTEWRRQTLAEASPILEEAV